MNHFVSDESLPLVMSNLRFAFVVVLLHNSHYPKSSFSIGSISSYKNNIILQDNMIALTILFIPLHLN